MNPGLKLPNHGGVGESSEATEPPGNDCSGLALEAAACSEDEESTVGAREIGALSDTGVMGS